MNAVDFKAVTPQECAKLLEDCADLLARPSGWVQGDHKKIIPRSSHESLIAFDLVGALNFANPDKSHTIAYPGDVVRECYLHLEQHLGLENPPYDEAGAALEAWNDEPSRTQTDVVQLCRTVAKKLITNTGDLDG